MQNELLAWSRLREACQEARLPQPQMKPCETKGLLEVTIPGYKRRRTTDLEDALYSLTEWVHGYLSGMAATERANEEFEPKDYSIAEAACLAKRVLDSQGEGEHSDHKLLAKAVLHLTAHILENTDGTDQTNSD